MWSLTSFGITLRGLLNQKCRLLGITLAQAADTLPLTQGDLHKIIACQEPPSVEQLHHLCRWLGVSADDLLGLQEP